MAVHRLLVGNRDVALEITLFYPLKYLLLIRQIRKRSTPFQPDDACNENEHRIQSTKCPIYTLAIGSLPVGPDDIRFASIKEDRDWYFIEYYPPLPGYRFSILQLSILEPRNGDEIATAMEHEATAWVSRYPVPLMATAFTLDGSVLSLLNARPINHLFAWSETTMAKTILRWEIVKDDELPTVALDRNYLKQIFLGIPYKTGQEIRAAADKHFATLRLGWWLVFVWAVVVPLMVAVLEWWSDLLGLVVLTYAFVKAAIQALCLTGHLPRSKREREKEAEESKMRHYTYHCERNPEAFERLKLENFEREAIEKTKAEAAALKAKQPPGSTDG